MTDDDIAIVGIGCRFPGADNVSEFWNVLSKGENHVKEIPKRRWNNDTFYDSDPNKPGKTYVQKAGFVNRFDEWDNRFFGINDFEAEGIDPQQRMVLECVHMALEDGGITRKDMDGTDTGVYIGVMTDDYLNQTLRDTETSNTYTVTGIHRSIISARVSYVYNLLGPAMSIDTACSSSLVAIDLGSQALRLGECNAVICGGVNSLLDPSMFVTLAKARMLSPTGQCHTYSDNADGYARGEGCGIVILKRLKDAVKDNNNIWATIRTGTNQDGHNATPITAPSGQQQQNLLERVYGKSNIDKELVTVIEAHGTGTPIGDPVEANALGTFFNKNVKKQRQVMIGSVKTNVGHLESAAGVAGLIKVLLMMKHKTIVPTLMYEKERENPKLNFDKYSFVVPTKCHTWEKSLDQDTVACVNSFGFGGTNAHAIVKEYKSSTKTTDQNTNQDSASQKTHACMITISADNEKSLKENVTGFQETLKTRRYDLESIAYTSTCKRDHRSHRKAFLAKNQQELIKQCEIFTNENDASHDRKQTTKLVFVFCGVGTAWAGMCKEMMAHDVFRMTVQDIDVFLFPLAGWTIENKLNSTGDILEDPFLNHIAIFVCQVGLVAVWKYFGIHPAVVVGQSVGEVAAAFVAGCIDLKSAVEIIYYRSKYLAEVTGGSMAVVKNVQIATIEKWCQSNHGSLEIAVYNSPVSCTVSGKKEEIIKLKEGIRQMEDGNGALIELDVKCAYHSQHVDKAASNFSNGMTELKLGKQTIPIISSVSGKRETSTCFAKTEYWRNNVRSPVRFSDAIRATTTTDEPVIFLEIGPSPVLRAHIESIFNGNTANVAIPSMQKGKEMSTMLQSLCVLYERGFDPNWDNCIPFSGHTTDIPMYTFHRTKNLFQNPSVVLKNQGTDLAESTHLYIRRMPNEDGNVQYKAVIDEETTPFVFQHFVRGSIIVPGAFYVDVGVEVGKDVLGASRKEILVALEFLKPVWLKKGTKATLEISTRTSADQATVEFYVTYELAVRCKGTVRKADRTNDLNNKITDVSLLELAILKSQTETRTHNEMYNSLEKKGFKYGKCFQVMQSCISNRTECLVDMIVPSSILDDMDRTTIHPCIFDGILQASMNVIDTQFNEENQQELFNFLPVGIEQVRVLRKPEREMKLHVTKSSSTLLETVVQLHFNCTLLNKDGDIVALVTNFTTFGRRNGWNTPVELQYCLSWRQLPHQQIHGSCEEVLVITNITDTDKMKDFQNEQTSVCVQKFDSFTNESNSHRDSKWYLIDNCDAIVVLFEKYNVENDLDSSDISRIYSETKCNCMFLVKFLKTLVEKGINKPLFIVTQNSQQLSKETKDPPVVSLLGSEVWGFIRSIQIEFVQEQLTLVDVQPSLQATKSALMRFISKHVGETSNTEVIIYKDDVFKPEFSMMPMFGKMSLLQESKYGTETTSSVLKSSSSGIVFEPFLETAMDCEQPGTQHIQGTITMKIQSVCLHSSSLYPPTTTEAYGMNDRWHKSDQGSHTVIGIEYTGVSIDSQHKSNYRCYDEKIDVIEEALQSRWEMVAVLPSEIKSIMTVPDECTVSTKDIPFYQPGLLMHSLMLWEMTKCVPHNSNCLIIFGKENAFQAAILEKMLISLKKARMISSSKQLEYIDVALVLNDSPLVKECFWKVKTIIAYNGCLSESIKKTFFIESHRTIIEVDVNNVLNRVYISKYLKKVVVWLRKHFSTIHPMASRIGMNSKKGDVGHALLCTTVDLTKHISRKISSHNQFDKAGAYIITGGLTGLGWELLKKMAENGAGTLAALSRRAVNTEKTQEIAKLEDETGCKIICLQADVADLSSVQKAVKSLQSAKGTGAIKGVFHGAGILDSRLLLNLEEKHLDNAMRPKIIGAMNLHIATRNLDLDYFLMQSSITSIIGAPGQSNYGAANGFLDSFALWLRQRGMPGQAINWGALNVGMAVENDFAENFEKRGHRLLTVPEIRGCFEHALMTNATGVVYSNLDWDLIAHDYEIDRMKTRLKLKMEHVIKQRSTRTITEDKQRKEVQKINIHSLQKEDKETQIGELHIFVLGIANQVIVSDVRELKMSTHLAEVGLDSMSAVLFINIIHEATRCRIPHGFMLDGEGTFLKVVEYLHAELFKITSHL